MANRKPPCADVFTPDGVLCASADETCTLGVAFGEAADARTVISLEGPLGAGKTRFAQGIAAGLGCDTEASSPTFAVVHEYAGGRLAMFHFDFYRLEDRSELVTAGFDDALGAGVTVIEWGDKFPDMLPAGTIRLRFALAGPNERRITGEVMAPHGEGTA